MESQLRIEGETVASHPRARSGSAMALPENCPGLDHARKDHARKDYARKDYARISVATDPATSVRRISRPAWR